jgi:FeS assembly SUF system protein
LLKICGRLTKNIVNIMPLTEEQIQELGEKIVEKLKTIYDPEIPVDIYELGLIYDVQISTEGEAEVLMTLTTPNCPVAETLPIEVEEKIKSIDGIKKAKVTITFEPSWDKDMMSEEAKFDLGLL